MLADVRTTTPSIAASNSKGPKCVKTTPLAAEGMPATAGPALNGLNGQRSLELAHRMLLSSGTVMLDETCTILPSITERSISLGCHPIVDMSKIMLAKFSELIVADARITALSIDMRSPPYGDCNNPSDPAANAVFVTSCVVILGNAHMRTPSRAI
jgi:hypothetical protein